MKLIICSCQSIKEVLKHLQGHCDPVDVDLSVFKGYFLYARQVAT